MKKLLLSLSILAIGATAVGAELPLNEKFTLKKGDTYDFNPTSDGILTIEFEGEYPEESIIWSNLYNSDYNQEMGMLPLSSINVNPAMGQMSPAKFEIKQFQPEASGSTSAVKYRIQGPDQTNIFDPSASIYSMEITCTFEAAGDGGVLEPSVEPANGTTLGYYDIANLSVYFTPETYGVKCGKIEISTYTGPTLVETLSGSELEMTWEYNSAESKYVINLQNLLLYKLSNSNIDIDKFTITLSDFNYELSGDLVNEDGSIVLTYNYDQWYGVITYKSSSKLPTLYPHPDSNTTLKLTYSDNLSDSGEVQLLGATIGDFNEEPSPKTNVYAPSYTVQDNSIIIDFSKFVQTGPVNDSGVVTTTDGYKTSGSTMTLLVRGFLGTDGSIVQPVLIHLDYSSTPVENDGVDAVEVVVAEEGEVEVYNLQGIRVLTSESGKTVSDLPAGIYIVNGKKQVVR